MKCFAWSLDTVGPVRGGVADVAFAAAAISGRDLRVDRATPAAPRIALVRTHIWAEASADMQGAVETGGARAARPPARRVKDVALPPIFEDAWRAHHASSSATRPTARSPTSSIDTARPARPDHCATMLDEAGDVDARRL